MADMVGLSAVRVARRLRQTGHQVPLVALVVGHPRCLPHRPLLLIFFFFALPWEPVLVPLVVPMPICFIIVFFLLSQGLSSASATNCGSSRRFSANSRRTGP